MTVRLEPPLDPTSPEARDWLEEELRRAIYRERPSLLQRAWDWFQDLLSRTAGTGGLPAWTIGVVVLVAIVLIALIVVRSMAAERRMAPTGAEGVLDGQVRSAGEHRAAAREALRRGDGEMAVLEAYRAIARSTVERTILDDQPGRTAHEVAVALAPVFPAQRAALAASADVFDAVRYGRRPARPGAAEDVLAVDAELAGTRPVFPDPATPSSARPGSS